MMYEWFPAIPCAIAGLGGVEIFIALMAIVMLIIRIGIPVAVIFLLYQWWKDKKNKSK